MMLEYRLNIRLTFFTAVLLLSINCYPSGDYNINSLPDNFEEKAFEHVEQLYNIGIRQAGSPNDRRAVDYISNRFRRIGLYLDIENFEFESYILDECNISINALEIKPVHIGFNPYGSAENLTGKAFLVDPAKPENISALDLENKNIFTTKRIDYFRLLREKAGMIVYVSEKDFGNISHLHGAEFSCKIGGKSERLNSANIVGIINPELQKNGSLIICAHFDSYRNSPGADDNATGIGVLIELADFFFKVKNRISCSLTFLALGAEELGVIGSRIYVREHEEDLKGCVSLVNLDRIGGSDSMILEVEGGVNNVSDIKGKSQISDDLSYRAWEGLSGKWRIAHSRLLEPFMASNIPEWYKTIIEKSISKLDLEIVRAQNLGADHSVFAQAGIASTSIGVMGNEIHTPNDVIENVNKKSMLKSAELCREIILNTLIHYKFIEIRNN